MITPPGFWQRADGAAHPLAFVLRPVAAFYDWAGQRRQQRTVPAVADGPVICVGNVSMGGVGKTPFAIMLAEILREEGQAPAFLTRGYGGAIKEPTLVADHHAATESGDEAQLLKTYGPVVVSPDRPAGAALVFGETTADVLIMDDGFQNPSLKKDLSFLLIDAETGFGNGLVFPAGPLRETPAAARSRTDAIVFVMPHAEFSPPDELLNFAEHSLLFRAWPEASAPKEAARVVAFCGIGRPEKFYRSARAAGYKVCATADFPDHHAYKESDLDRLANLAAMHDAALLTTEKDYVRLPPEFQLQVATLPVRMRVDKEEALKSLLEEKLRRD